MLAVKLVQHEFCFSLGLLTFFMGKFKYNNKYSYSKLQKEVDDGEIAFVIYNQKGLTWKSLFLLNI